MIRPDELTSIGQAAKPHGIEGEFNILLHSDRDIELADLSCIVMEMDGIFVPFFICSMRQRGADSILVRLDDIDNEVRAKEFNGKTVYVLKRECHTADDDLDDADGYYATDFIGFKVCDSDGEYLGTIDDVEDSTDNVLFIISRKDGSTLYIPVVDEFITAIDIDNKSLTMDLPTGLTAL